MQFLKILFWALIAFLEAALLRLCHPGAVPNYGLARGLASLSFVVGNIATGMLVDAIGTDGIWWWLTLTTVGLIAATFGMKPEPVARDREPPFGQRLADGLSMVKRPEFALLMFGCGIVTLALAFTASAEMLCVLRFLLGAIEAGLTALGIPHGTGALEAAAASIARSAGTADGGRH